MSADNFGIAAEFDTPEALLAAARQIAAGGYHHVEAYSPFPVEGLSESLGFHRSRIPVAVAIGAIAGGSAAFFMQWFASVIHLPWNIGGRPENSWPAFIPITFELSILGAATTAVLAMLLLNRLPQPYHPLFNLDAFTRASRDRFFLCVESTDPRFDPAVTRRLLESLSPLSVQEVPR